MRRVHSFMPMDSELEVQRLKRACQKVLEEPAKRQKIREASGAGEDQSAEKEKELSKEELQKLLVIVPVEEIYVEALQVKYPIINWEVYTEESRVYWKIIKVGNHIEAYQIFADMYMHDPLIWKLYDTCGVHHVSSSRGQDIFMLVEKDYPLTRGLMTVMLANKLQVDESSEMANELLRKIFYQANRPR
ncbi:hypothetical protein Tco_0261162 [Tanacetum coccineum]